MEQGAFHLTSNLKPNFYVHGNKDVSAVGAQVIPGTSLLFPFTPDYVPVLSPSQYSITEKVWPGTMSPGSAYLCLEIFMGKIFTIVRLS